MRKIILTAIAFCIAGTVAMSQTATPVVKERQVRQQKRIAQGVKSGELTPAETARLETREAKIQHDKKVAKSDGVVTPTEKAKLSREQNRTSRAIRRQKHDAQTAK
jgi:hypothetical protein